MSYTHPTRDEETEVASVRWVGRTQDEKERGDERRTLKQTQIEFSSEGCNSTSYGRGGKMKLCSTVFNPQ